MVTTVQEDENPEPIGAIAAFGGRVEVITRHAAERVSYGETSLLTPMVFVLLTLPAVLTTENPWLAALGVLALMGLLVWSVVEVVRKRK